MEAAYLIDSMLGNILPAPTANSVYMVYFPASTTVTTGTWSSCVQFGGYHSAVEPCANDNNLLSHG